MTDADAALVLWLATPPVVSVAVAATGVAVDWPRAGAAIGALVGGAGPVLFGLGVIALSPCPPEYALSCGEGNFFLVVACCLWSGLDLFLVLVVYLLWGRQTRSPPAAAGRRGS